MNRNRGIIVSGPVSSGKTTLAMNLAWILALLGMNPVYMDKDALVACSKAVFAVAEEPFDRDSEFFYEHVRDPEYWALNEMALQALRFNETVIINAPYTRELRSQGGQRFDRFVEFADRIHAQGGELIVVYIEISPEKLREQYELRLRTDREAADRTPELRDPEKLAAFCREKALPAPDLSRHGVDKLIVFHAEDADASFRKLTEELGIDAPQPFDPYINTKV